MRGRTKGENAEALSDEVVDEVVPRVTPGGEAMDECNGIARVKTLKFEEFNENEADQGRRQEEGRAGLERKASANSMIVIVGIEYK